MARVAWAASRRTPADRVSRLSAMEGARVKPLDIY